MSDYFPDVPDSIPYEGPDSRNPLAFRFYQPDRLVAGQPLEELLRFAVCWWHTLRGGGADMFGPAVHDRPWLQGSPEDVAAHTVDAGFELMMKLGIRFYCFHDVDVVAPGRDSLKMLHRGLDRMLGILARKQQKTGIQLLWSTSNLFSHRAYAQGAATSPDFRVFARAASQVKKMLEVGRELGEANHVFWGGREGYSTLFNTDLGRELDQLAVFLRYAADYAREIGNDAQLLIEPKPHEPTKHQYDFDAATCHAFLLKHGLADRFKLNIETNHATLAGHTMFHELEYARVNGILGSVDANRGDLLLGWDTDQFPDFPAALQIMLPILRNGGFGSGGLNFDAKVRRASCEVIDLVHAHLGGMDNLALAAMVADSIIESGDLDAVLEQRYRSWTSEVASRARSGGSSLAELAALAEAAGEPTVASGRQEALENLIRDHVVTVLRKL